MRTAIHEIGHRWCCSLKGFYPEESRVLPAHYHYGIGFAGQQEDVIDPFQGAFWMIEPGRAYCGTPNDRGKVARFSYLTRYLMGFAPPEDVLPALVRHWDTTATINKELGPGCNQLPAFVGEKTLAYRDIQRLHGMREPSHDRSQREFNVLPVVIVKHGDALETGYLKYLESLLDTLLPAWTEATAGVSKLRMGCDLHVGTGRERPRTADAPRLLRDAGGLRLDLGNWPREPLLVELLALDGRSLGTLFHGLPDPSRNIGLRALAAAPPPGAYVLRIRSRSRTGARIAGVLRW